MLAKWENTKNTRYYNDTSLFHSDFNSLRLADVTCFTLRDAT